MNVERDFIQCLLSFIGILLSKDSFFLINEIALFAFLWEINGPISMLKSHIFNLNSHPCWSKKTNSLSFDEVDDIHDSESSFFSLSLSSISFFFTSLYSLVSSSSLDSSLFSLTSISF